MNKQPIAVFDSGYGGLTVLRSIVAALPQYDYLYMGDNARAPYGPRSFEQVYQYTLQAVEWFFAQGCELVILACNTASAKALRSIQQNDLATLGSHKRVLGVIRPTAEVIGQFSKNGHVGVLGTKGTVMSGSYEIEIQKFSPETIVTQEACPMWVPLIENNEYESAGADYFVQQHIQQLMKKDPNTDCILLACTHYPLLMNKILQFVPPNISVIDQGAIVANSLADYLQRHPEMEERCSKNAQIRFYTTGDPADFDEHGSRFFGNPVQSNACSLL
jgi:glutamate racemase